MDRYFRSVELDVPAEAFHRLPRNAAYKYEYFDGRAVLTPRPKSFTCVLDLPAFRPGEATGFDVQPLPAADAGGLADLFAAAVRPTQPFASLDPAAARAAAGECYAATLAGQDGPLVEPACARAVDRRTGETVGGLLVTLVHDAILADPFAGAAVDPLPPDAVALRAGCPHLTWVFVDPWQVRRGVGTMLLGAAVRGLAEMGFGQLASTFLLDNGPSALWHWRSGFRLLSKYGVIRKLIAGQRDEELP